MYKITEKILIAGSNTTQVSKSLKEKGYIVYATSYFNNVDQRKYTDKLITPTKKQITKEYNPELIETLAKEYTNEVDRIICLAGVRPWKLPKNKIIGNKNTEKIDDKYKQYQKLKKDFQIPETHKLNSIQEAKEISKNFPKKKYITKPIQGCGGVNIKWLENTLEQEKPFLLQEYVNGTPLSSSLLRTPNNNTCVITTSQQIIGSQKLGQHPFGYCGNITPSIQETKKITNISKKIAETYKLIGSNGVDFVLDDNKLYLIEVNPRIQGTIECIENSYNINLPEAHIDACSNKIVTIPEPNQFSIKLILFAKQNLVYKHVNLEGIQDIPPENMKIQKGEPILSVVTSDKILENAMNKAENIQRQIYFNLER
ncbi:MAG: ATP-grasp domain-containing protein [Methanobacteriaceae archaeon]|nr:ATP-grasp domain-containing protein [Methanobacteriaceae archaeon]